MRSHFMAQLLKFIHIQMNGWNEQRMLQVITRYKYHRITFPSHEAGTAFFCDDSDEVSAKLLGAVIIINIVY